MLPTRPQQLGLLIMLFVVSPFALARWFLS